MGCGKSSVGRKLSELLCCPFMDLDKVIEECAGRTITEIFSQDGEPAFRQMELETLQTIVSSEGLVLALGGGAVMTRECEDIVRGETVCVYLKASVETLLEHLEGEAEGRPMLRAEKSGELRERIENLMTIRSATYEKTAHIIIDTDGKSIDEIAMEIKEAIQL